MEESQRVVIEQMTVTLPFLDEEVPALSLADGRLYIPVYAVCHALGIRADVHIRRWQHLLLWSTARKLPLQMQKRGKHLVWCLLISQVPYLYCLFDWQLVSPQLRMHLRQATEEQAKLADLAYQRMQQDYEALRRGLFKFLTTYACFEKTLQRCAEELLPLFDVNLCIDLEILLEKGRCLYQQTTILARKMLLDQDETTIIDSFAVNAEGRLIETYSFPLFPIVSDQDSKQFFISIDMLTRWYQDLHDFWVQHSFL
jgi:hypothetical protein